ncbi:MAG: glycosyltransferase family 4 protein [Candidatus Methylarchaceae archaeon HK01B]|nr:glycosyltransferase family 4 protein [Candidatus Methylarchaceae archaeon HK01B]
MSSIALTHSSFSEFGGAEQVIIHQAKGLGRLGHKVTCFTSTSSDEKFPELQVQCYGTEIPSPFGRLLINISLNVMMASKIADKLQSYNLILSHHHPGPLIAYEAKKKFGIPYVAYIHHLPLFLYPLEVDKKTIKWAHNGSRFAIETLSRSPGINQWLKGADIRSIMYADAILTNSQYVNHQIRSVYHREAQICRPGVDASFFQNLSDDPRIMAFKRQYGLGDNVMLLVARMTPQKKFDWALKILKLVKSKVKDVQLAIKTEIPNCNRWSQALFQKVNFSMASNSAKGSVRWITNLDRKDLPLLYNSAKVYICTSVKEAFGISPIEAMACGLPVVAWDDYSGTSEYIINGQNGYLCHPYELEDFVKKVSSILSNEDGGKGMGKKAMEYVKKNFDWNIHLRILDSVLSRV